MPDEPSALTDQSRDAARDIADWCADRHVAMSRTATQQLTFIWLLVASGIVALLFLPLVIEFIDFRLRAQSPPREVVANAESAALALVADVDARRLQKTRIADEIAAAETEIKGLAEQVQRNRETVRTEREALKRQIESIQDEIRKVRRKRASLAKERSEKLAASVGFAGTVQKPVIEAEYAARIASVDAELATLDAQLNAVQVRRVTLPIDADPRIAGLLATQEGLKVALDAQIAGLSTAESSLQEQLKVVDTVRATNEALEAALKTAEPVRQAVSITTRVALLGLLIYLVQILVNRYRYMQRLAGFYQARAQAFQLVASTPEGRVAEMLDGVKLGELTAALSPDAIGFDKSADPPTNQISTLLQAAIRR